MTGVSLNLLKGELNMDKLTFRELNFLSQRLNPDVAGVNALSRDDDRHKQETNIIIKRNKHAVDEIKISRNQRLREQLEKKKSRHSFITFSKVSKNMTIKHKEQTFPMYHSYK